MSVSNQCISCKHFWGGNACEAFPDGIIEEVMTGEITHTKVLSFQANDIVYIEAEFDGEPPELKDVEL